MNMLKMIIQNGLTALHMASDNGHVAVVRLLIQAHAVINLQSKVKNSLSCTMYVYVLRKVEVNFHIVQ